MYELAAQLFRIVMLCKDIFPCINSTHDSAYCVLNVHGVASTDGLTYVWHAWRRAVAAACHEASVGCLKRPSNPPPRARQPPHSESFQPTHIHQRKLCNSYSRIFQSHPTKHGTCLAHAFSAVHIPFWCCLRTSTHHDYASDRKKSIVLPHSHP